MMPLRRGFWRSQISLLETESRRLVAGGGGRGVCHGDGASVWEDEKVLEMGGGRDGRTTV